MKTLAVGAAAFLATVAAGMLLYPRSETTAEPVGAPVAAPAAAAGERIAIPTVGLSVVWPAGWTIVTAEENVRNLRSVQMDDAQL